MLPLELRSERARRAWSVVRCQCRRRHRLGILPGYDSSSSSSLRSFATSFTVASTFPSRRSNLPESQWTIPFPRPDRRVFADSLEDTLESHRDTNSQSVIRKHVARHGNERLSGFARPMLDFELPQHPDAKKQDPPQGPPVANGEKSKQRKSDSRPAEYIGISQPPKKEWAISNHAAYQEERRPWLAHLKLPHLSDGQVHRYLSAEILAFAKYVNPTSCEKAAVGKALSDVRRVVAKIDPDMKTSVIGSRTTGLAMPLSDIDINIEPPKAGMRNKVRRRKLRGSPTLARRQAIGLLSTIRRGMKKKGGPKPEFTVPAVVEAKVPIISARHNGTGLEIQLQSTKDCHASTEMVKAYVGEFPTLRPLFLVLRQVLKMRGLGEPRTSGIGSYSLIMMIVATLKFSGTRFHREDAARHLLYFLDFYTKIEFRTTCIAVDPPELFPKFHKHKAGPSKAAMADVEAIRLSIGTATRHSDDSLTNVSLARKIISGTNKERPYLMCLQDPVNPLNDLGVHTTTIKHVQATFTTLRGKIKTAMDMYESRTREISFSLLEPCLAGNYRLFEKERERLERFGEELVERPQVVACL